MNIKLRRYKMTWYIVLGLIILFGFYLLSSNKSKRTKIEPPSGQNVHDPEPNHSGHDHKKGHGCC